MPFLTVSFLGEGPPTKKKTEKVGTLILTSLLEDLGVSQHRIALSGGYSFCAGFPFAHHSTPLSGSMLIGGRVNVDEPQEAGSLGLGQNQTTKTSAGLSSCFFHLPRQAMLIPVTFWGSVFDLQHGEDLLPVMASLTYCAPSPPMFSLETHISFSTPRQAACPDPWGSICFSSPDSCWCSAENEKWNDPEVNHPSSGLL